MPRPPAPPGKEQRLLRHARREALLIMIVWAAALAWSVGAGYVLGYDPRREVRLILGMPDWVFWCIFVPWGCCVLLTAWFCFFFMADDDLGQDRDGGDGHA